LTAEDGETHDHFGFSVSMSGDYAIVGAPGAVSSGCLKEANPRAHVSVR